MHFVIKNNEIYHNFPIYLKKILAEKSNRIHKEEQITESLKRSLQTVEAPTAIPRESLPFVEAAKRSTILSDGPQTTSSGDSLYKSIGPGEVDTNSVECQTDLIENLSDSCIIKYNRDFLDEQTRENPFDIISDKQEIVLSFIHIGIDNFIVFPRTSIDISGFSVMYSINGDTIKYKQNTGDFKLEKGFFYKLTSFILISEKSPKCTLFYQFFNKTTGSFIGVHSNASNRSTKCIAYIQPDEQTYVSLRNKSMDTPYCLLTGSLKIKCSNYSTV